MYVEVPINLNHFDDYVPFSPLTNSTEDGEKEKTQALWSKAGVKSKNSKSFCESERKFARPSIAQDITGKWLVIVQTSLYNQRTPVEICRYC